MKYSFQISQDWWDKINKFAYESAESTRKKQSGGKKVRSVKETKRDIRQGKVGEVIIKLFLELYGVPNITLDFENYGTGRWDEADMVIGDKSISIKSTKPYGRWLLINTKDINRGDVYDYFILVTIDFSKGKENCLPSGVIRGYIDKKRLLSDDPIVKHLKQGEFIPGTRTRLDADNYGVHSNDLYKTEAWTSLINLLIKESNKSLKS